MDIFMNQLAAHGYEGQSVLTDSSEFGLPARRRRLYIFLVRVDGNPLLCFQDRSVDSIFTTFGGLLGGCTRTGPCASSILLTDEDGAVLAELRFRQKRRAELSQNQPDKPVAGDWADQHMKMAQSMNVRWGVAPPTELASNPWFATFNWKGERCASPLASPSAQDPHAWFVSKPWPGQCSNLEAWDWKAHCAHHAPKNECLGGACRACEKGTHAARPRRLAIPRLSSHPVSRGIGRLAETSAGRWPSCRGLPAACATKGWAKKAEAVYHEGCRAAAGAGHVAYMETFWSADAGPGRQCHGITCCDDNATVCLCFCQLAL